MQLSLLVLLINISLLYFNSLVAEILYATFFYGDSQRPTCSNFNSLVAEILYATSDEIVKNMKNS